MYLLAFLLFFADYSLADPSEKPENDWVILRYHIGSLEKPAYMKQAIHCEILLANAKKPKEREKLIHALTTAKNQPLQQAMHIVATVPSRELWAYPNSKDPSEKVLLWRDHSALLYRKGKETSLLKAFADAFCDEQKKATKP